MIIGRVSVLCNGAECEVEWKIPDLDSSSIKDGELYCSDSFSFGGAKWDLGIYPSGSQLRNSVGHIGVGLCRVVSGAPIDVQYSVAFKTVNGQKDFERKMTGMFEKSNVYVFIVRFLSRSEYARKKSLFLVSGILTIVCTLAPLNADPECTYCKEIVVTEDISTHEKKCMDRPIKCLACSDLVLLKNWLDGHECQFKIIEGGINASVSCGVLPKSKILKDLKQLFLNQDNSDVVLRVKGREFPAHKAILMARSSVFASTFRHNMKEKETGIVDIEDCDPSSFSNFLCFMYCEELDELSQENVFSLFTAADKYDVTDLRTKCMEFMKENVSVDTFCETISIALQHRETELLYSTTDFFINNAEEILETVKWQTFASENPTQSNELFIKYVKSMKHSNK